MRWRCGAPTHCTYGSYITGQPCSCRGFQDIREEQCQTVHETEHTQMRMAWLPPGPREARDHRLQAMMLPKGWDEEDLRMQWEGVSRTFGYNAREAVEWWVSWGMLRERSLKSRKFGSSLDMTFPDFSGRNSAVKP